MQHRKSLRDGSPSLFGAKITGGGSGGSVCVIGRNCIQSSEEILEVLSFYFLWKRIETLNYRRFCSQPFQLNFFSLALPWLLLFLSELFRLVRSAILLKLMALLVITIEC